MSVGMLDSFHSISFPGPANFLRRMLDENEGI